MMLVLTNVCGLVYSGCPRSCLMDVVPIGDTREENKADKEIGPAGPQTIPSL